MRVVSSATACGCRYSSMLIRAGEPKSPTSSWKRSTGPSASRSRSAGVFSDVLVATARPSPSSCRSLAARLCVSYIYRDQELQVPGRRRGLPGQDHGGDGGRGAAEGG